MQTNQETYGCLNIGFGFLTLFFVFIAGWLVYGSLGAAFWVVLLWMAIGLATLAGFVPLIGPYLYWKLATVYVLPAILGAAGIPTSWLTTGGLWLGLFSSVMWTLSGLAIVLSIFTTDRRAAQETTSPYRLSR